MPSAIRSTLLRGGIWVERTGNSRRILELAKAVAPVPIDRNLIRVGPPSDGGYLIPDDLEGLSACVSPGVAAECGFDLDLAKRGLKVLMLDASVSAPPIAHPNFHFDKLFLDTYSSSDTTTLKECVCKTPPGSDLILEMDIEGAEYRVISSSDSVTLERFRTIVIEFHDLHHLFTDFGFREISSCFSKILTTHRVVHIHPNNIADVWSMDGIDIPQLMEFTFYRRDRCVGLAVDKSPVFPHPLDGRNVSYRPDVTLPSMWTSRQRTLGLS